MDVPRRQYFFPRSLHELFLLWDQYPEAILFAGGTEILQGQTNFRFEIPSIILNLGAIEELKKISRTERYLEIGSMVPLADILSLGKLLPPFFIATVEGMANPLIQNLATIGGALCARKRASDLHGPLIAMDAMYELRDENGGQWISASRFQYLREQHIIEGKKVLSRVRIPLETWNQFYQIRFGSYPTPLPYTSYGCALMVARVEKEVLSDFRFIVTSKQVLRHKEMELKLLGSQVPLEQSVVEQSLKSWKEGYQKIWDQEPYLWEVSSRALEEALVYRLTI